MSAQKQYIKEIKKEFRAGYNATWLPGVPLELGAIGVFDKDGTFHRKANLKDRKVNFTVLPDHTGEELAYKSQGSASITTKLSGQVPIQGSSLGENDAGVIVNFSKNKLILFKAKNVTYPSIADQIQLEEDIMKLYEQGKWKKEWCVITQLAIAESATIIISNSANNKIELKAKANIKATEIDIVDAAFDFSVLSENEKDIIIIAKSGLTPLFKAQKLNFKKGDLKRYRTAPSNNFTEDIALVDFVLPDEEIQLG